MSVTPEQFRRYILPVLDTQLAIAQMEEELALHVYGFTPRPVLGDPGLEVWQDDTGSLYTREGAMRAIRYLASIGQAEAYPPEWLGPLEELEGVGPMLESPKPLV